MNRTTIQMSNDRRLDVDWEIVEFDPNVERASRVPGQAGVSFAPIWTVRAQCILHRITVTIGGAELAVEQLSPHYVVGASGASLEGVARELMHKAHAHALALAAVANANDDDETHH